MIKFNKVVFKNFMSYGNAPTELLLDQYHISVIVGKNGNGKSTILSSICYALYGKPFNDAQKSKIVNNINGKNLLVELWFEVNSVEYQIRRGQVPNIFEIYKDGLLIPQESTTKKYQELLENQILKLNIKTFKQTILIGTASFTPFMEMSAADRRMVIENILGVEVLSSMNQLVRVKENDVDVLLKNINQTLQNIKIQVDSEKTQIDTLKNIKKQSKEKYDEKIAELKNSIDDNTKLVENATTNLSKLLPYKDKYDKVLKAKAELNNQISSILSLVKNSKKQLSFIETHDFCPICQQAITDSHKNEISERTNSDVSENQKKIEEIQSKLKVYSDGEEKLLKVIDKISEINNSISEANMKIRYANNSIKKLIDERDEPIVGDNDIEKHKENIIKIAEQAKTILEQKEEKINEKHLIEQSEILLKDSGIKAKIVNQYLPLINQKVNEYLEAMDFFISFTLDNEFNETIKARERDEFKYFNLSQGERRRLDLALILTWRYIISKRAEYDSNLLFLDEIEYGLDVDGITSLMNMLQTMNGANIFIITHNNSIQDSRIDKYYEVEKINQFSVLSETVPD